MKIDIYNHILPKPYFDKMVSMSPQGAYMQKRVREIPMLYDTDARFEKIDQFGEDYVQIVSLNLPPIEALDLPDETLRKNYNKHRTKLAQYSAPELQPGDKVLSHFKVKEDWGNCAGTQRAQE